MTRVSVRDTVSTLSTHDLELFAYHVTVLSRDTGKFRLLWNNRPVEVEVVPNRFSAMAGNVWDSVTMDGHAVGNRQGAVKAYARFVAGESDWWRPL